MTNKKIYFVIETTNEKGKKYAYIWSFTSNDNFKIYLEHNKNITCFIVCETKKKAESLEEAKKIFIKKCKAEIKENLNYCITLFDHLYNIFVSKIWEQLENNYKNNTL